MKNNRHRLLGSSMRLLGIITAALVLPAAVLALSQGYKSTDTLVPGMLVALNNKPGEVVAATTGKIEDLIGVVVAPSDSLLSVSSADAQYQVITSGVTSVIVSTIGGDIKAGDKITASPLVGVGAKANISTRVIGVAQADFNSSSTGATKRTLKDSTGKSQDVYVGQIAVLIDVTNYVAGTGDEKTVIPAFVQQLSNAIAGKKVSPLRIIIASVILLLSLIIVSVLVYGATRNSIISIGRNPLSQQAVYKSLAQVFILVVAILAVSLGSVYLILSR